MPLTDKKKVEIRKQLVEWLHSNIVGVRDSEDEETAYAIRVVEDLVTILENDQYWEKLDE